MANGWSTVHHVSTSSLCHPGRSDFPHPVGAPSLLVPSSHYGGGFSVHPHTPLTNAACNRSRGMRSHHPPYCRILRDNPCFIPRERLQARHVIASEIFHGIHYSAAISLCLPAVAGYGSRGATGRTGKFSVPGCRLTASALSSSPKSASPRISSLVSAATTDHCAPCHPFL